jgi:hypothetical protein
MAASYAADAARQAEHRRDSRAAALGAEDLLERKRKNRDIDHLNGFYAAYLSSACLPCQQFCGAESAGILAFGTAQLGRRDLPQQLPPISGIG